MRPSGRWYWTSPLVCLPSSVNQKAGIENVKKKHGTDQNMNGPTPILRMISHRYKEEQTTVP